jgi:hypothetical protein
MSDGKSDLHLLACGLAAGLLGQARIRRER